MAKRDEIIRYVIETTGDKALAATVGQLLDAAKASGQTAEQIDALGESLRSLATDAAETKGLQDAVARFGELAAKQEEVADAADRAGLALKLSTQAEEAAADVLARKNAALAEAKAAQADYAAQENRLLLVERELAAAVKDASAEQKAANAEWKASASGLASATAQYEKTADAQSRIGAEMSALEKTLSAAKLSTTDLAAAQRELAARSDAAQQGLAGLVSEGTAAAARTKELADATAKYRAEQAQTADAIKRHAAATAQAKTEADDLGKSTEVVTGVMGKLRGVLATITGFFSFATLASGLRSMIGAANESEQALGQLDAVLQSTRGAAGLTKAALVDMASELAKSTNFGKEEIIAAQTRLLSYTDVAGKEFPRALQIVLDQSARLGISIEQSAEIVGKALQSPSDAMSSLARQGFKLEDGQKQLLEQMEATGRTAEAQAVIMDMLAESYGGAAAKARVSTLAGLWDALTKKIGDFYERVSNAGVLDYFKQRLDALTKSIEQLELNGTLDRWATNVANAIIGVAKAVESTGRFLAQYADAIILVAKAYALVKVQAFVDGLAAVASGATKASSGVRLLATAITAIPAVRILVIGGAAIALATDNLKALGDKIAESLPAYQRWKDVTAQLEAETVQLAERYHTITAALDQYRDVQVKTSEQVAALGAAERQSYGERLAGLEQYLNAQVRYYEQLKAANALNADGVKYLEDLRGKLAQVQQGYADFATAATAARDAIGNQLTAAAQVLANKLAGLGDSTKGAADRISELLKNFEQLDRVELGTIALALESIGDTSDRAGQRIRDGLVAQLTKLSADELLRFQMSATAAFDEVGRSGDKTAVILGSTLKAAMDKLNVDAGKTGQAFTESGREIITTFNVVADNARATSGQIEAAFAAALGGVKTRQEAEALGAALEGAAARGKIGAADLERAMRALHSRVRDLTNAVDPLADEFGRLGIKSQSALNAARDSAREAFEAIAKGAAKGKASQEDVVRAFKAYAQAAQAAAADSTAAVRDQVDGQLALQAAALGISDAFAAAGAAGKKAGEDSAAGFDRAKQSIDKARDATADYANTASAAHGDATQAASTTVAVMGGVVALTAEQTRAMRSLNEELSRGATYQTLSLDVAKQSLEQLGGMLGAGEQVLRQRIEGLNDAAQRAKQITQDMANQAADLQDQIDEIRGRDDEIEDRRHQKKLADLKAEAEANNTLNTVEYRNLIALETELHDLKMSNLRAQKQQQAANAPVTSAAGSPQPQPTTQQPQSATTFGVIKFDLGGQTVDVRGTKDTAADLKNMIDTLRRARARTGGWG